MAYYLLKDNEPEEGEFYEYWYDFAEEQHDTSQEFEQHTPGFGRFPNNISPLKLPGLS